MTITYKQAGVNIDAGEETVRRIKEKVKTTFSKHVLTGLGSFGAVYDIKEAFAEYKHPLMVQSVDGVGTKLIIARMMDKYDTVGIDIVSNCAGDIVAMGAKPLTFLDYIASERLDPNQVETIVKSMVHECIENNISLVGGETAEMPGVYKTGEHDIVGCITGVVEKDKVITGKNIKSGDIILGFASNGLHTNGYSLARKLFFEIEKYGVETKIAEFEKSVGETLLEPHTNYTNPILRILDNEIEIKGIAHITGGGFIENIPRILPNNCAVEINKKSWPHLPVFEVMQQIGNIEEKEMYRTFNMGIGMILVISPENIVKTFEQITKYPKFKLYEIGKVVEGNKNVKLI
ncbi:MAG: phosphoribosylformylglycinamidine cyclo-ligase [Candidatus Magasanikbacteria bacterium RIFCSPHIGHO2_01_FULL_33_34]|uniref:Phosphoribosylformylglycinamidine cyclo-ligase n=1 Tax=Candidatus Magasanikbacteria bacterium RIFCSPHIGHO2_01_FULL_33_34 TaxID=1798671 RepID=A0A1F6LHM6_9BACT|nr:MAG: phosphoribosylformylglycinamidine cyclo-ligase [Candidatus Magasanikbacteria bacterium RIFCSPHIGHO2_01_FULL_33_34]OGH65094.1 MAG: phosphoribosylformylglycinamidine cyclo-ligase [Candidatus Magasanikbacteria bacterium RIFCSPHIGHO2_02_FULL_33_17]OGH75362.1 MAG: phosphoribosylformylglycinamidine cyclo-ligase [Candidatus Magasanikbacteria bacterium RIFCSPLOWO2_01_FULL_33_34]OGH81732.1 MAG: phosphoribosylformylglycinamidine cyclo-ligase [Candidatus Magasanikbacteria bacterium RIFCSPLOWO2_12_F